MSIKQTQHGKQRWTGTVERRLIMGKRPRRAMHATVLSDCPVAVLNGLHVNARGDSVHLTLREARTVYRVLRKHFEAAAE